MRIFVNANPCAKEEKVEKVSEEIFKVFVKEPPVKGKANIAVIFSLSKYFNVNPSHVKIISGYKSRQKTIEIKL